MKELEVKVLPKVPNQEDSIINNPYAPLGKKSQENESKKDCKKYAQITPSIRMAFIKKVLSRHSTIREASIEFGIKFSTSKAILQTFRKEGRVGKKKFRQRRSKDGSNRIVEFPTPKDLELFQRLEEQEQNNIKEFEEISEQEQQPCKLNTQPKKQMENKSVQVNMQLDTQPKTFGMGYIPPSQQGMLPVPPPSIFQSQCFMIHPLQFQKTQLQLQRVQMELDQTKHMNLRLTEIISGFQRENFKQNDVIKCEGDQMEPNMIQNRPTSKGRSTQQEF